MISFPNCKINLGLYVTAKRTDGYHDLETVFFPVPLNDILEFIPSSTESFHTSGIPVLGNASDNLCLKAYGLMKQQHPELPPLSIHLHKVIPMGAGLGGGSADGAFMLSMLNSYFSLGHSEEELIQMALMLGSDCPFFIINQPAHALGRGEVLTRIRLSLKGLYLSIVNPGIHVSTAEAFRGVTPRPTTTDLKNRLLEPVETWKEWLGNDFETGVFALHPAIRQVKQKLYDAGAAYASMSGSGSTVYGIFRQKPSLSFPGTYLIQTVQIKH